MASNQFDITELFKQLDLKEVSRKMQDSFNVRLGAINEVQSKNLQVIMNVNKTMTDGAQGALQKQAEMFQAAMKKVSKVVEPLSGAGFTQEACSHASRAHENS